MKFTAAINIFLTTLLILKSTLLFADDIKTDATNAIYTEKNLTIFVTATHPEFILKLKSNRTTGYSWFLRDYDAHFISPVKHSFQAPDRKLIGAPGYELWIFHVKKAAFVVPHQMTIRMVYARPWENINNFAPLVFRITTQNNQH